MIIFDNRLLSGESHMWQQFHRSIFKGVIAPFSLTIFNQKYCRQLYILNEITRYFPQNMKCKKITFNYGYLYFFKHLHSTHSDHRLRQKTEKIQGTIIWCLFNTLSLF